MDNKTFVFGLDDDDQKNLENLIDIVNKYSEDFKNHNKGFSLLAKSKKIVYLTKEEIKKILHHDEENDKEYLLFKYDGEIYVYEIDNDELNKIKEELNVRIEEITKNTYILKSEKMYVDDTSKILVAITYISMYLLSPIFTILISFIIYLVKKNKFTYEHLKNQIFFVINIFLGVIISILLVFTVIGIIIAIPLIIYYVIYGLIFPLLGLYYSLKGETKIPGLIKI